MATQGLVTVQDADGEVLMKIVVGMDGHKAKETADAIKQAWPIEAAEAYRISLDIGFGTEDSLVVMTGLETVFRGVGELDRLYRETFGKPHFNPRWSRGSADNTEIITIRNGTSQESD